MKLIELFDSHRDAYNYLCNISSLFSDASLNIFPRLTLRGSLDDNLFPKCIILGGGGFLLSLEKGRDIYPQNTFLLVKKIQRPTFTSRKFIK